MITYEVNLQVNNEIYQQYYQWLVEEHLQEMLQFRGFEKAELLQDETSENDGQSTKLIVHFTIKSPEDLQVYLQNHAATMRAASKEKFGDKFSATRRVFRSLVKI